MRRRRKLPKGLRRAVIADQWGLCDVCREPLEVGIAEIDHVVPVACGGSDARENLHALCPNCHARKTRKEAGMRRSGAGALLCWVCGAVVSPHFVHRCSGQYWYQ